MKIESIYDEAFRPYGRVLGDGDWSGLIKKMNEIPLPEEGVMYQPAIESLEAGPEKELFSASVYGGMPVELGMCWGKNTKLNCLEYHRDSEMNLGAEDFILLVAKQEEIVDGVLDTSCVRAFRAPANVLVEVYATTLHYAPCHVDPEKGFRTLIVLPRGTNTEKPELSGILPEEKFLVARNKWLLAHPESAEAKNGAAVGLKGINIDIAE